MEDGHGGPEGSPGSPARLKPIPKDKLKKRWAGEEGDEAHSHTSSPDRRKADSEALSSLLAQQETNMESLVKASKALEDENMQFKRVIMHREYEQQLLALQSEVRQSTKLMRAQNDELLARLKDRDAQLAAHAQERAALEEAAAAARRKCAEVAAAKEDVEHHKLFLRGELDKALALADALRSERDAAVAGCEANKRLVAELDGARRDLTEAEAEARGLRAANRELREGRAREEEAWGARVRALEGELKGLRSAGQRAERLEAALRDKTSESEARGARVGNLEKVVEGLTREAQGLRAQINPLQEGLASARAELDERTRAELAQRARADTAEEALTAVRGERDALFASLAASLRRAEEERDAAEGRERALKEGAEAREAEAAEAGKQLRATLTKLEAELVYRDEGNTELQKTIDSLKSVPPTIEADGEEGMGPDRLTQLQDENQLLQRLTGLQETMSRLNASSEWARGEDDADTTIAERRSFTDFDLNGAGHEGLGMHLNYSVTSDRSTVLQDQGELDAHRHHGTESRMSAASVKSAERQGLLSATSGLKWESWSPQFDLCMSSYYISRDKEVPPAKEPAREVAPAKPVHVARPPPPEPEPPLNSSNHRGTYLTPGHSSNGR